LDELQSSLQGTILSCLPFQGKHQNINFKEFADNKIWYKSAFEKLSSNSWLSFVSQVS
jgi:hypothetical protein